MFMTEEAEFRYVKPNDRTTFTKDLRLTVL